MSSEPQSNESPDAVSSQRRSSFAGLLQAAGRWVGANRLKAALLVGSVLASAGAALGLWFVLGSQAAAEFTLPLTLDALDNGRFSDARRMAESLRRQGPLPSETLGGLAFVLGAAAAYEADQTWTNGRKDLYLLASRYLEEARDRGFPEGRQPEGLLLLGRSLYESDQIAASRPALRDALEANTGQATEIHRLLAEACMNDSVPQYAEALRENTSYLSDRSLSSRERQRGLLQRAKILLHLDHISECLDTLAQIPADAADRAEAVVLEGQVLLHQARELIGSVDTADTDALKKAELEHREKIQAAIDTFREAESRDTLSADVSCRAAYLTGVCLQELKEHRAALKQFERVRKVYPDTPETLAATFAEAEIARQLRYDQTAVANFRRVLSRIVSPETFVNPWLSLAELRQRLLIAYREYLAAEKFDCCRALIGQLHPLLPRKQQMELAAQTYRQWGRSLLAEAAAQPPSKAMPTAGKGREKLRAAGREFERLSRLRIADREYPDDLWEAAEANLAGHDFRSAARLFQAYLKNETRRRHPRALVGLAEAMLALDRTDEAIAACEECIEFHSRDAAAFSARLLAAGAHAEKGRGQEAKQLLHDNVSGEFLTPASKEWRESLFDLGRLLHREGEYEAATERLREAIQRYPDSPRAVEAEYLLADCCRLTAKRLEEKLRQDRVENIRLARSKQTRELLDAALVRYRTIQEKLARRQETDELSDLQKKTLRNCYFMIGQMLFELGQYDDAAKAYVMVTNRYQSAPEVLDAYLQLARTYWRLDKAAEARGTLQQAKIVLGRMKSDVPFEETTNYSRRQWTTLLEQLTAT